MLASSEVFAQGLTTPYGIAFDMDENLFVAERQTGNIQRLDPDGKKSVFTQISGNPRALAFDDSNDLFVTVENRHQLLIVSPDQEMAVYAHSCNGRHFVAPRSFCFSPSGSLFFTDADGAIYSVDIDGEVVQRARGLPDPDGLVVSGDASSMYVAAGNSIVWLELGEDDSLDQPQTFLQFDDETRPHSLLFDSEGVLYIACHGQGIVVADPDANIIQTLQLPGPDPMGMTFGGVDYDRLFVAETQTGSIHVFSLDHSGQRPFAGPRSV